ncbi:nucleoside monophosphate kinase [Patescibacteria group bacterium]|nr:nucleoside monophosphate kinase [Patescibacteria group bacterium]MBU1472285.1 nucleoside monophosphate kinase [Patescibacteria group bacterium]MBU2460464.1 nucleoside monophosphate kinase [Patescibacteria group bacterium]MBU2543999.1 nucleoside monophosphate kinase [Patescibacteria group bacterium]
MHIVFYGPEGSGKGTQAKLLSDKLRTPILTSGDLVRTAAANDKGIIGEVCRQALSEGKYVADSEMFVLWKWRLKEDDAQNDWIMDGFPRKVEQAKFLGDKLDKYGYKVDAVIYLKISEEESMKRLIARARPLHSGSDVLHDSPDRISQRLSIYQGGEQEVLEYYRAKGVLIEINGERPIDVVHQDIMSHIPA